MDRREQIAHLAATREEEMLLVRVCEQLDPAVQRDIPAASARSAASCRTLRWGSV